MNKIKTSHLKQLFFSLCKTLYKPCLKFLIISSFILGLFIVSCKKETIEQEVKLPVKFILKKNFQDWFKRLVQDDSLVFINDNSDTIYMKSDGLIDDLFYSQNESRRGQQLTNYFTCQSDYLKTFKLGYQLYAMNDSSAILMMVSISGNLTGNSKSPNYTFSTASIFVHSMNDSFSFEKKDCRMSFSDSVILKTGSFKPSYFIDSSLNLKKGFLTEHFYFNQRRGFIGFNTWDNTEWARLIKK